MRRADNTAARAVIRDPAILTRFWASVDRTSLEDGCWEWRDTPSCRYGYSVFRVRNHSVSVARVAWFAATGEFPFGGRIRHSCGNVACVRPQHLVWELGMMAERALVATANGYASLAGTGTAGRPTLDISPYLRAS